jgi:hypothetical protein
MQREQPTYSIVVPVGPTPEESGRLEDLRVSLLRHETHRVKVILVDDAPEPRALDTIWPGAQVIRTSVWESSVADPLTAQVAGSIEAFKHAKGRFALKLDTDALVIAPFYEKIAARLDGDPLIGIAGAYGRTPNGELRDWSRWPLLIRLASLPVAVRRGRSGRRSLRWRSREQRAVVHGVLAAAGANPHYELGAHCLGGAYAVSRDLLRHAQDWEWAPWADAGLGEDVVLALLCAADGMRMEGMVQAGDPFGISWRGLPGEPDDLISRGFSIVHSLKDCAYGTERDLRQQFRESQAKRVSG